MPKLNGVDLEVLKDQILGGIKDTLRGEWEALTLREKDLVHECALDAAKLTVQAVAGGAVAAQKAHVDAQLANIKSASQGTADRILWGAVKKILDLAATALVG